MPTEERERRGDNTSEGREFLVMAAATGNERQPTVDSWKDGTYIWYDVDERSRRRL